MATQKHQQSLTVRSDAPGNTPLQCVHEPLSTFCMLPILSSAPGMRCMSSKSSQSSFQQLHRAALFIAAHCHQPQGMAALTPSHAAAGGMCALASALLLWHLQVVCARATPPCRPALLQSLSATVFHTARPANASTSSYKGRTTPNDTVISMQQTWTATTPAQTFGTSQVCTCEKDGVRAHGRGCQVMNENARQLLLLVRWVACHLQLSCVRLLSVLHHLEHGIPGNRCTCRH